MHLEIRGTSVHSCYDALNKLEPNVDEGNLDFLLAEDESRRTLYMQRR